MGRTYEGRIIVTQYVGPEDERCPCGVRTRYQIMGEDRGSLRSAISLDHCEWVELMSLDHCEWVELA